MAQAPPPPPPIAGNLPASRLKSEIGDRRIEPPLCVQNAMMTKDKKPFTYTPGGIDLSEIKSPRMARRIERNANAPGVGELPVTTHTGPSRPLPPSALAAMQPALPVQVFPSGAPPPPPPPPSNAPPPPPPMQALPTKIVASTEGTFERPDMTRIIPENPMSLLRKTPKVERKTFLDELNDMENKNLNGNNKQDVVYAQPVQQQQQQQKQQQQPSNGQYEQSRPQFRNDSPPSQQQRSPSYQPSVQQFQPPVQQYQPPVQPVQQYQPPVQQYQPPVQPVQQYQPPVQQYQPPVQQYQPPQYQPQPQYVQNSFQPNASNFGQQTPSTPQPNQFGQFGQNGQNGGQHKSSNIGSLYIPPVEQYQAEPTPPTPPQRHSQPQSPQPSSPLTPKLNPAPKPWQNQKREQEKPAWAQRPQQQQQMSPQPMQPMQPIQPMSPSSPMPPPPTQGSARITVMPPRITPVEMNPPPTQPGVERVYVTQPAVFQHPGPRDPNTRVIPVQVERTVPQTPERNLSRQQSWTPSQSNSFKVLQKMTNTEADDVDDDTDDHQMSVEHGPRNSQQFPVEQMRKMQVSNNDQFRSRQDSLFFNKGFDDELRYPGGLIRFFADYAPSSQPTNRQPTVRTIPIQIEGDDNQQQKPYVHPSQQPVQESQMYMGAAMPSRAFRMVQAMNEANSPASFVVACNDVNSELHQWGYGPYWHDYYYYYPPYTDHPSKPYWGYYDTNNESEKMCSNCRNTPVSPYYYPEYPEYYPENESADESSNSYDNYYYYYPPPTYPYPPYYYHPHHPQYYPADHSGYSSNDEMAANQNQKTDQSKADQSKEEEKHEIPDDVSDSTVVENEDDNEKDLDADRESSSDDEDDEEVEEIYRKSASNVPEIRVSISPQSGDDEDDSITENEDEEPCEVEDDTIPHVLSVIFEESECSVLNRNSRESSLSEDTIIDDNIEEIHNLALENLCVENIEDTITSKYKDIKDIKDTKVQNEEYKAVGDIPPMCSTLKNFETCKENKDTKENIKETPESLSSKVPMEDEKPNEKTEEEEIDFWSQINQEEDILPRRNRIYSNYNRDSWYSVQSNEDYEETTANEELTSETTTVETTSDTLKTTNISEKELNQITTVFNSGNDDVMNFVTSVKESITDTVSTTKNIASHESRKDSLEHSIVSSKIGDLESTVYKTNETQKSCLKEIRVNIEDDIVQKICTQESVVNKICTQREELKETLRPPLINFGFEECFKRLQQEINSNQVDNNNNSENSESSICSRSSSSSQESDLDCEYEEEKKKDEDFQPNMPTIKDRIKALHEASNYVKNKEKKCTEDEDDDSGVTSDMSRHISDNESEVLEFRKMIKYQRAATHSRLYKLLQGDEDDENDEHCATTKNKHQLTLPLNLDNSNSSSGINSPQISEELVNELVRSFLEKKKQQLNVPIEKLQEAAYKILQEDKDCKDLSSSEEFNSFLSPLLSSSGNATAAQTPQEFYSNSYKQYYDSWSVDNNNSKPIVPNVRVKCPRVKNLHKGLAMELSNPNES